VALADGGHSVATPVGGAGPSPLVGAALEGERGGGHCPGTLRRCADGGLSPPPFVVAADQWPPRSPAARLRHPRRRWQPTPPTGRPARATAWAGGSLPFVHSRVSCWGAANCLGTPVRAAATYRPGGGGVFIDSGAATLSSGPPLAHPSPPWVCGPCSFGLCRAHGGGHARCRPCHARVDVASGVLTAVRRGTTAATLTRTVQAGLLYGRARVPGRQRRRRWVAGRCTTTSRQQPSTVQRSPRPWRPSSLPPWP